MTNKVYNLIISLFVIVALSSCGKDALTPYSEPFLHIMKDEVSFANVSPQANYIATYNVYLSSFTLDSDLEVKFEIIAGDGLVDGVDYQLVNESTTLLFKPHIYDMPIRIKWMPKEIDDSKNNTLTIRLVSNSKNITMGLPGPDKIQREFIIYKKN